MTLRQAKKIAFRIAGGTFSRKGELRWTRASRLVRRALRRRSPMLPRLYYRKPGAGFYFVDEGAGCIPASLWEWGLWFEDIHARRVAHTLVGRRGVSTIGLGFDHGGGALYESATFAIDDDGKYEYEPCDRYRTRREAVEGHRALVAQLPPSDAS